MISTSLCQPCGTGINLLNTSTPKVVNIGGSRTSNYYINVFENAKYGIFSKGDFDLTIQGNDFNDLEFGIRCNKNSENIVIDEENIFSDVKLGVILFNVSGDLLVDGNEFNDPTERLDNPNYFRTAITVQNPSANRFINKDVFITNNVISRYRIGIHGINIGEMEVGSNAIDFNITDDATLVNFHGGIWLQNCPRAFVTENSIYNSVFMPHVNFRGIDIAGSLNCDLNCNVIDKLGIAINFDNHCDGTQLRQNHLSDYDIGINFNNALIHLIQGIPGAPNDETAWDNTWSVDPTYSFKVGGQLLGTPTPINWYHQGLDDQNEEFSPNPFDGLIVNPIPSQNSSGVACSTTSISSNDRIVLYGAVVGDSLTFEEYSAENTYLANVIAYEAMKSDSTIIYQYDSFDADFEAYFTRHDTSNIGKFYLVESLMDREPDSAMTIAGTIVADNEIESYLLEHYVRSQEILDRGGDLSGADSAFYLERTTGAATTQGAVYYYGLGQLFIEQHPPLISSRMGQQSVTELLLNKEETKTELTVFPNPSTGLLTLKLVDREAIISGVEVYNSIGEMILSKRIEKNNFQLDMSPFVQGIYFIRCHDHNNEYYTKSVNLLK